MQDSKNSRTSKIVPFLPSLLEAALAGNRQGVELSTLSLVRLLKTDHPTVADELSALLDKAGLGEKALRWHTMEPPPVDADGGLALLKVGRKGLAKEPIFEPALQDLVNRFVRERTESESLIREGYLPPRTLLLKGLPGTGKTMLAHWLAQTLEMPFVVLDLATAISSFLGKTGGNLRRSLDYARATPCVLLLDEFDAIGKRRDDETEVGELKRIVNVLLKELEDWPHHSILIAATNHPELLDPAIHRRFDVVWEMPLPGILQAESILKRSCGRFAESLPVGFFTAIAYALRGWSGSQLESFAQSLVRRHLVDQIPLITCFLQDIPKHMSSELPKKDASEVIKLFQRATGYTVRELAKLFGKSVSTIHHHLSKE